MVRLVLSLCLTVFLVAAALPAGAARLDPYPPGTYRNTCKDFSFTSINRGLTLNARCGAGGYEWRESSIFVDQCLFGDITNNHGYLACNRSVPPAPEGCKNMSWQPWSYLKAECTKPDGKTAVFELNTDRCENITSLVFVLHEQLSRLTCKLKKS